MHEWRYWLGACQLVISKSFFVCGCSFLYKYEVRSITHMVYKGEADTVSKPKWRVTTRTVDMYACYVWWHPRWLLHQKILSQKTVSTEKPLHQKPLWPEKRLCARNLLRQRAFTSKVLYTTRLSHQKIQKAFTPSSFRREDACSRNLFGQRAVTQRTKSFPPKDFRKTYCRCDSGGMVVI